MRFEWNDFTPTFPYVRIQESIYGVCANQIKKNNNFPLTNFQILKLNETLLFDYKRRNGGVIIQTGTFILFFNVQCTKVLNK